MPDNVVTAYIEPESGLLATTECPNARMEVFVAGTEPAEYCSPVEWEEPMTQPDSEEQKNHGGINCCGGGQSDISGQHHITSVTSQENPFDELGIRQLEWRRTFPIIRFPAAF